MEAEKSAGGLSTEAFEIENDFIAPSLNPGLQPENLGSFENKTEPSQNQKPTTELHIPVRVIDAWEKIGDR